MTKLTIVSLAAGRSQITIIDVAKKMGYNVIGIDQNSQAMGKEYVDIFINADLTDANKIIKELHHLEKNYKIVGMVSSITGKALYTASRLSEEFNLTGLTHDLVELTVKKSKLRGFCQQNDIPTPEGKTNSIFSSINFSYPIIIKPDHSVVSKSNTYLCSNLKDIKKYFNSVDVNYNNFEIQSFIDGIDCTCLCWAKNGNAVIIAWFDELVGVMQGGEIHGFGASIPSVINETHTKKEAEILIKKIVEKFPHVNSILWISFRVTMDGKPFVTEINARLGGDLITEKLFPLASNNYDLFKLTIKIATNTVDKIEQLTSKPTILYSYQSDIAASSQTDYENFKSIQYSDVTKNLIKFREDLSNTNLQLFIFPKHELWLKRNLLA